VAEETAAPDKPFRLLPRLTDEAAPFWTGGQRGELVFWRCNADGYWIHPWGPVCPQCLSRDIAPQASSGRGVVHSFTVNEQNWNPTMPPPYVVALVELDDQVGLRLMTNIVNCDPSSVAIGQRVRVTFEEHAGDTWIPLFEPADG
jgi:uncharacterized OB-fold protein